MVGAIPQGDLDGAGADANDNMASGRLMADDADTTQEELDHELRTQPLLDSVRSKTARTIRMLCSFDIDLVVTLN